MMPSSGYRCSVELSLDIVSSPGTHLPNRDLLYVAIEVFGQAKRTRLLDAVFPLCVHERFRFERCFWSAKDAREVLDLLGDAVVNIELRQVTDVYLGGCLLAHYETDARNFFQVMANGPFRSGDRLASLNRTVDFPGPAPRLEFTTSAFIEELPGNGLGGGLGAGSFSHLLDGDGNSRRSRPRERQSPTPPSPAPLQPATTNGHERQTVSTVMHQSSKPTARSPSPSAAGAGRPPFVVRRVDDSLVSRKPTLHDNFAHLAATSQQTPPPRRSRSALDLVQPGATAPEGTQKPAPRTCRAGGSRSQRARSPSPAARPGQTLGRRYPSLTALPDLPRSLLPPPYTAGYYYPYYYNNPYYYSYYYPYYSRYSQYPYYWDELDLLEMDLRLAQRRHLYG